MSTRLHYFSAIVLAAATVASGSAQEADWDRWSVSIAVGPTHGGPAKSMGHQLAAENWDDTSEGFFGGGGTAHPFVTKPEPGSAVRVGYRFRPSYGVALMRAEDHLGYASGYRDGEVFGSYLGFNPSVQTLALFASYFPTGAHEPLMFRLDAGPALYEVRPGRGGAMERRVGLVLGAGAGLRIWKFRLSVDAQTRRVGDLEYGPYEVVDAFDGQVHTFGEYSASFDHTAFLFGLGLTL
jgi:hypothetical protein